mmetsp:Transcript_29708/g.96779  ORF Transcript_29708/g.96779 Transcript_29708/m.96779 type:complete len:225 (-) Transcript_29708:2281-2955(-)
MRVGRGGGARRVRMWAPSVVVSAEELVAPVGAIEGFGVLRHVIHHRRLVLPVPSVVLESKDSIQGRGGFRCEEEAIDGAENLQERGVCGPVAPEQGRAHAAVLIDVAVPYFGDEADIRWPRRELWREAHCEQESSAVVRGRRWSVEHCFPESHLLAARVQIEWQRRLLILGRLHRRLELSHDALRRRRGQRLAPTTAIALRRCGGGVGRINLHVLSAQEVLRVD